MKFLPGGGGDDDNLGCIEERETGKMSAMGIESGHLGQHLRSLSSGIASWAQWVWH